MKCGYKIRLSIALVVLVTLSISQNALAANPAKKTAVPVASFSQTDIDIRNAYGLYSQNTFSASAEAFEAIIRTAPPSAKLYYFAALANRASGRNIRAKQLSEYVIARFPATQES